MYNASIKSIVATYSTRARC